MSTCSFIHSIYHHPTKKSTNVMRTLIVYLCDTCPRLFDEVLACHTHETEHSVATIHSPSPPTQQYTTTLRRPVAVPQSPSPATPYQPALGTPTPYQPALGTPTPYQPALGTPTRVTGNAKRMHHPRVVHNNLTWHEQHGHTDNTQSRRARSYSESVRSAVNASPSAANVTLPTHTTHSSPSHPMSDAAALPVPSSTGAQQRKRPYTRAVATAVNSLLATAALATLAPTSVHSADKPAAKRSTKKK